MLRVFIIRIACLNSAHASLLLKPMVFWIFDRLSELSSLSDADAYKVIIISVFTLSSSWKHLILPPDITFFVHVFQVYRLLDFLSILLDHPRAKVFFALYIFF